MTAEAVKPVLRWPGSKWMLADRIAALLPPHRVYCEPFFGSGAILFRKHPTQFEIANDLDGEVVNLFRCLRESTEDLARAVDLTPCARSEYAAAIDPPEDLSDVERARRFLVRSWQGRAPSDATGPQRWRWQPTAATHKSYVRQWAGLPDRLHAAAARLKGVQIDCRDALDVLRDVNHPQACVYVDPPYHPDTRHRRLYAREYDATDHAVLLGTLQMSRALVVLSGYDTPMYRERLWSWERVTLRGSADGGQEREEVLWLNPAAARARRQPDLFEVPQ